MLENPKEIISSTKTPYTYIHQGLVAIKPIDLPKVVHIRKKSKTQPSTKKHLGIAIDKRPDHINDRFTFGHWEIDSVLGLKTTGEPSVMTSVEHQTRYAQTIKLP